MQKPEKKGTRATGYCALGLTVSFTYIFVELTWHFNGYFDVPTVSYIYLIRCFRWNTTYLDYSSSVSSDIDYGMFGVSLTYLSICMCSAVP